MEKTSNKQIYYTVYKITNIINNKIYIGVHKTTNLNDNYLGSGSLLFKSKLKYGKQNFKKETLFIYDNEKDMFKKESELVNNEFILNNATYNLKLGGIGSWPEEFKLKKNEKFVYDIDFNIIKINKKDFNSEIHTEMMKNKVVCKWADNRNNYYFILSKLDELYLSGEAIYYAKNTQIVRDKNNKKFRVDLNDERYKSKELISIFDNLVFKRNINTGKYKWVCKNKHNTNEWEHFTQNKVVVKYANNKGKNFLCDKGDERLKSGELISCNKQTFTAKDKEGNTIKINVDDKRYKSGELSGINKNMVVVKYKDNRNKEFFQVCADDERYKSGELIPFNVGHVVTEETKTKISEKAKARKGTTNWIYNEFTNSRTKIKKENLEEFLKNNKDWKKGKGPTK